jgi:hypothetical protein
MTGEHDRHKESFATEETRYEQLAAEEERAREAAAARLAAHPLPDPDDACPRGAPAVAPGAGGACGLIPRG